MESQVEKLARQVKTLARRMARWHVNMRSRRAFGTLHAGLLARKPRWHASTLARRHAWQRDLANSQDSIHFGIFQAA